MGLCYFGRKLVVSTYQETCRGAFNGMVLTAALKSPPFASLMKVLGISTRNFPASRNLFVFGAVAGGIRGALVVAIDRLDFLSLKESCEKPYQISRFAITFFVSLKMADWACRGVNVPIKLSWKVAFIALSDYGLSLAMNQVFDPLRRPT